MKAGARVVAGVALGYVLGRNRKMKLAITAGSVLAGRKLASDPKKVLSQGATALTGSPEFSKLTGELRGQVVDAARLVATRRFDAVTRSFDERAAKLRSVSRGKDESSASAGSGPGAEDG